MIGNEAIRHSCVTFTSFSRSWLVGLRMVTRRKMALLTPSSPCVKAPPPIALAASWKGSSTTWHSVSPPRRRSPYANVLISSWKDTVCTFQMSSAYFPPFLRPEHRACLWHDVDWRLRRSDLLPREFKVRAFRTRPINRAGRMSLRSASPGKTIDEFRFIQTIIDRQSRPFSWCWYQTWINGNSYYFSPKQYMIYNLYWALISTHTSLRKSLILSRPIIYQLWPWVIPFQSLPIR